jgi:dynein heavy chain
MADKDTLDTPEIAIRLWVHETLRVFSDRLVNTEDRLKFLDEIRDTVRKIFGSNFDNVFEHLL